MDTTSNNAENLSLIFFGSGPLAAQSLEFLYQVFTVEAVITKPRPEHHKGSVPVLEFCQERDIKHMTPANKTELSHLFETSQFASRLGVVIDYGIIINRDVIDTFPLGIVNSHFSLLPEWRGADPITFSLLSGQAETGVSLMLINEKMDEGPLLAQAPIAITPSSNAYTLTADLIETSNVLLDQILPLYAANQLQPIPQTSSISSVEEPTYSRKLTKADGVLDWHKPAAQLEREIRAFIEWPKSRTTLGTIETVITAAHTEADHSQHVPGTLSINTLEGSLKVRCKDDLLVIDRLKPAGKNEMSSAEFIRGYSSRLNS